MVAFEIDAVAGENQVGWSVVVHGTTGETETIDESLKARSCRSSRGDATNNRWLTITPTEVNRPLRPVRRR